MPSFSYNDIEINYIMEGSGEPIVFVSGTFTKLQMWNYQTKHDDLIIPQIVTKKYSV